MGVEKVLAKKEHGLNEVELNRYYKTKEELYKKYIFNDNPINIEQKFKLK